MPEDKKEEEVGVGVSFFIPGKLYSLKQRSVFFNATFFEKAIKDFSAPLCGFFINEDEPMMYISTFDGFKHGYVVFHLFLYKNIKVFTTVSLLNNNSSSPEAHWNQLLS